MTLGTILLMAAAVVVAIIMLRVGRGNREKAHAQAAVGPPDPGHQGQADPTGHGDHGQDSEGGGRRCHGCC